MLVEKAEQEEECQKMSKSGKWLVESPFGVCPASAKGPFSKELCASTTMLKVLGRVGRGRRFAA